MTTRFRRLLNGLTVLLIVCSVGFHDDGDTTDEDRDDHPVSVSVLGRVQHV